MIQKDCIRLRMLGILAFILLLIPFDALAVEEPREEMTISQAYKAIPHSRTQYNPEISPVSDREKKYLDHLFFVTDLALQKRIMMLRHFKATSDHRYIKTYNQEIDNILASFKLIPAPTKELRKIEDEIVVAINQQKKFFNTWHEARDTPLYRELHRNHTGDAWVQKSHQTLIRAYMLLKKAYPNEAQHNQKAFFDHLCALDFI